MKHTLALISALAMFCGSALAGGASFSEVDADKDGTVTMEEIAAAGMSEEKAKAADANQDGHIDIVEFAALEAE